VDDLDLPCEISVEVVYVDEHLIELEAIVRGSHWRGRASAYTVPEDIATFAAVLERFAAGAVGGAEFTAGADNGAGLIAFRFYRIDRAGHIACHVRLASGRLSTGHRPEQVSQLAVEVGAEAEGVGRFSRQLGELTRARSGRASLAVEPNP
jgi:hypothetical protein